MSLCDRHQKVSFLCTFVKSFVFVLLQKDTSVLFPGQKVDSEILKGWFTVQLSKMF